MLLMLRFYTIERKTQVWSLVLRHSTRRVALAGSTNRPDLPRASDGNRTRMDHIGNVMPNH
jgi:hypothetical protein